MADYVEWGHLHAKTGLSGIHSSSLKGWVEELMSARKNQDQVRIGDILEYEIIPLLSQEELSKS